MFFGNFFLNKSERYLPNVIDGNISRNKINTYTAIDVKNQSLQIDSKNYDIPNTSRGMKEKTKINLDRLSGEEVVL